MPRTSVASGTLAALQVHRCADAFPRGFSIDWLLPRAQKHFAVTREEYEAELHLLKGISHTRVEDASRTLPDAPQIWFLTSDGLLEARRQGFATK